MSADVECTVCSASVTLWLPADYAGSEEQMQQEYLQKAVRKWNTRIPELKPCPLCGSVAKVEGDKVFCTSCLFYVDNHKEPEECPSSIVEKWNRRVEKP